MTPSPAALGDPAALSVAVDSLTAPPLNSAFVRFIHASPNAPAVTVIIGQTKVFSKVSYRGTTGYAALAPSNSILFDGIYLQPVGSATSIPIGYLNAQPGMAYTIIASGFVGGSGNQILQAIVTEDV